MIALVGGHVGARTGAVSLSVSVCPVRGLWNRGWVDEKALVVDQVENGEVVRLVLVVVSQIQLGHFLDLLGRKDSDYGFVAIENRRRLESKLF